MSTTYFNEYNLVENPYSVSLIRTISASNTSVGSYWRGFFALDNLTLLSYSDAFPSTLYTLDITTTTAVDTLVWSSLNTRQMVGNVLYTTNGRVLYLNIDNNALPNTYLTQKVYSTGVQEYDTLIGSPGQSFSNIFQEGNAIYVTSNTPTSGFVYQVNPTNSPTLTLVGTFTGTSLSGLGNAAQPSSCITIPINPASWDGAI